HRCTRLQPKTIRGRLRRDNLRAAAQASGMAIKPRRVGVFQGFWGSVHFVTGSRSETNYQPASSMQTDCARCVMGSGRPCSVNRQASQVISGGRASRTSTELNPYACDLRFHQLLVSL
ncbi:MAG TPA: hypothetical protein VEG33_18275, partial [Streptosporangiaceae bacterium]|nr:hypothetical protein [Streptosporangiaceae bacterium]